MSGGNKIIIFAVILMVVLIATIITVLVLRAKYPSGYKKIALLILVVEFIILVIMYFLISKGIIKF